MLKQIRVIDYNANYAYAPPSTDAVINTEEIVSIKPLDPYVTRSSYELVRIRFRDGSTVDAVGKPSDFLAPWGGLET